jgi:hypothetical protein
MVMGIQIPGGGEVFLHKLTVTPQEGHYVGFCVGKVEDTFFKLSWTHLIGNLEVVIVT